VWGPITTVQQLVDRFSELNCYLLVFPEDNPKQLNQYEITKILDQDNCSRKEVIGTSFRRNQLQSKPKNCKEQ